jgi:hypothetical protein
MIIGPKEPSLTTASRLTGSLDGFLGPMIMRAFAALAGVFEPVTALWLRTS